MEICPELVKMKLKRFRFHLECCQQILRAITLMLSLEARSSHFNVLHSVMFPV